MAPTWAQAALSSILLLSVQVWGLQCPASCSCLQIESKVSADCGGSAGEPSNITAIPKGFPANTSSIYLVHHRVGALSESSFQGLDRLSVLYLFANKIDSIALRTFSNLKNLRVLDLSYNQLSTLEADHLQPLEASLQELYLDGNPWHCTCNLLPFQLWLKKMDTKVADGMYISCASPDALNGKPLLELTRADMGC
ncbi:leucine-rich repeat-containing protein 3-like isoform X3 [Ambystoma mexicanum]|uniref:leucine-rich repeat-containing protein 3-like isoform X2 n=1 Tax=Ambystoma mexicanum TaxID=8296 RepID=UPI0037E85761